MRELHTQETIKLAADLWRSGLSASKVANKLGMTRNAVIGLSHRNRHLFVRKAPQPLKERKKPCTCHPDDNPPVPCPRMFALSDCRLAAVKKPRRLNTKRKLPADVTHLKPGPARSVAPVFASTPVPEAIKTSCDAARFPHARTLTDLQPNACKWALTNGKPYLFCAAESNNVSPYCQHHAMRAYQPREKRA